MSLRGFGNQTLTGSPQPLLGTLLTAAVFPTPDRNTGSLAPGSQNSSAVLPITANTTTLFRQGDHVAVGASSTFTQSNTTAPDGGTVQSVSSAANTLTVTGLQRNHSSGEWVLLAMPCAQINIQNGGATLYLGEDSTVGATSSTLIATVAASAAYSIGSPGLGNMLETQHLWVVETASNTFLPNLLTI